MALALNILDGFDHLATAHLGRKWTVAGSPEIATTYGRNGTSGVTCGYGDTLSRTVSPVASALWMGAVTYSGITATYYQNPVRFLEAGTAHVVLRVKANGVLAVMNDSTELATSGAVSLLPGTSYHIAIAVTVGNAGGKFDVWLNGVKVITGTGDTQNGGTGVIDQVSFGAYSANAGDWGFDDVAIYTGATYTDADFPGDCRVMTSRPNGAGNYGQWTGTYADVDDTTPDDDTTALTDATAGNISTFTMTPIAGTGTVKGVQLNLMARKDDAGARTIASVARLGTTDAVGATVATGLTFVDYMTQMPTKPGGGAWTVDDVNACEFGIKTIA